MQSSGVSSGEGGPLSSMCSTSRAPPPTSMPPSVLTKPACCSGRLAALHPVWRHKAVSRVQLNYMPLLLLYKKVL